MIFRLSQDTGFIRIHALSDALSVQPPSATKMVQKLHELGLLKYEKYGYLMLEPRGREIGAALLRRHNIIESLLKLLGVPSAKVACETEKRKSISSATTRPYIETYTASSRAIRTSRSGMMPFGKAESRIDPAPGSPQLKRRRTRSFWNGSFSYPSAGRKPYAQKRCFPITASRGRLQIHALVAVSGLK
jgi:Mn-dependent DtxR family transcriptional regulator